jgi:O-antigen/teichoic acid export membrane protein
MKAEQHFCTEHLQADLKGRSIRGGAVTLTGQGCRFALQTGSIVILARLLTPGDFGLIAMVTAITGFIASFKDAGLSMATVQREKIDHAQVSTLFWINVVLSTAMMVQHQALLRRQLRFRALVAIDIASRVVGIAVAIVAAAWGAGCWALVLMAAVTALGNAAGVWIACDWRPGLPRRGCGVRSMLAFGGNLTVSHVVNNGARNLDNVLIGSVWGASLLGAYSKAYQLLLLPFQQFASPVTAVALPVLSRLQGDPQRFRRYFRGGIMLLTALGMPLVAFAFVTAHDLTLLVLGDQWTAAAPIFMALAPAAFVETFNVANGWAFIPMGRTDRYLRCVVASSVVIMAAFAIGLPWGAIGVACGYSAARVGLRLPQAVYAFHGTPLTLGDLGAAVWRPAAASVLAAVVLWAATMSQAWPVSSAGRIGTGLPVYAAVYGLLLVLLPGGRGCMAQVASIRDALLGRPAPIAAS